MRQDGRRQTGMQIGPGELISAGLGWEDCALPAATWRAAKSPCWRGERASLAPPSPDASRCRNRGNAGSPKRSAPPIPAPRHPSRPRHRARPRSSRTHHTQLESSALSSLRPLPHDARVRGRGEAGRWQIGPKRWRLPWYGWPRKNSTGGI